jgi:hypothetical protein
MSQKDFVIEQLNNSGEITRNQCLKNYISRLGAIICQLKKEGWMFRAENRGGDYVYIKLDTSVRPTTFNKQKELETLRQGEMFDKPKKPHYLYD